MCGISGAWLNGSPAIEQALFDSLASLRHRGPDGQGVHIEPGIALGMRRLSIIDIEGGDQPIWNETSDVCIVFNGEIYNYVELIRSLANQGHTFRTRSDTEAIVHAYEDDPYRFATRLRGMFSLAIYDRRHGRMILARDRFGKKPLYYTRSPNNDLVFASELKGLLPLMRAVSAPIEIEPQGIYDYLSLGSVPQPATIYRNVYSLPPGNLLIVDRSGQELQEYWQPTFESEFKGTYEDAQTAVREKIAEAVKLRLRSDVPLGSFLSAGVDSTIVTYEAARLVGEQLQTFTVASDDPEIDESKVAQRSALAFGVRNSLLHLEIDPLKDLSFLVNAYDQPFADPSAIPSLAVSKAAREHVKVVLSGDGGDELFGGYRRHVAAQNLSKVAWIPKTLAKSVSRALTPEKRSRRSAAGLIGRMLRGIALPPEARYLAWTSDMLREDDKAPAWNGGRARPTEELVLQRMPPGLAGLNLQAGTELRLNLLSSLLVKMDIATSAYSLEGRSPLLDHELGELALSLPPDFKVRGGKAKAILRDTYAQLLPSEVTKGKKRGFEIPLLRWLTGPWQPLVQDLLGARNARVLEYLDQSLVSRVIDENSFLDRNKAYITYSFLVLELWLRQHDNA